MPRGTITLVNYGSSWSTDYRGSPRAPGELYLQPRIFLHSCESLYELKPTPVEIPPGARGHSGNTVSDRRGFRCSRGFPCRVTRTPMGSCGRPWVPRETVGAVEDSVRSRGKPSMLVETPAETLGGTGGSVGDGGIIQTRNRRRPS